MQNSKKRKLKPQNLLIVLACICLIIGTFVVLLSNRSTSNSDSKTKTVNKHYETIATVMIDAGHGGYDGGTVAEDGTTEKDLTLALALETGKQLKKLNPEIKVVYTRTSDKVTWSEDETEDLKARVKMAKKEKADYFFSFHINSNEDPTCSGYVSYIRQDDKASEQITEYICKNLSGLDWTHDRGTLTTEFYPLHVVDEQKIPAILFEAGFSTNTKEIQKLNSDELVDLDAIAKLLGYTGCVLVDTLTSPKGYRLLFKIPRIPTNVIENLIKHFGQLKNVLEASSEDLDQVEGIGEARAAAIKNGLKRIKEQVNLKKEL